MPKSLIIASSLALPRHLAQREENMSQNKQLIRSSAVEYLSFIASTGQSGVEAIYADENIWLTQKLMAALYDVETHTINYHLKKIFADGELSEDSVIRNFRITACKLGTQTVRIAVERVVTSTSTMDDRSQLS